jgi:alkaline phosphatase
MNSGSRALRLGRRAFLQNAALVMLAGSAQTSRLRADQPLSSPLKIGLLTDLHYADKPSAGTRFYRETLRKLEEAARHFEQAQPKFVVELGDLIDAADAVDIEQRYLKTIQRHFAAVSDQRHYVLGNHCVDTLTKQEFLDGVEQQQAHYSFDHQGFHFIVLDACYRADGQAYGRKNFQWTDANIPPAELEWLVADLRSNDRPVIVFVHQRLDVSNNHGIKNQREVRQILSASGRVLAVFQGHSHQNDWNEIDGIHYCTLVAMVEGSGDENNGYSLLSIEQGGTLTLSGFRKQVSHQWKRDQ